MSIEKMKMISEAEAGAMQIRKDAAAEAKRLQDACKKESAALTAQARAEAQEAYSAVLADAEQEASKAYDEHLDKVRKECEIKSELARTHKDEAIKYIIGKVVGVSGNS